ncbi:putative RNA polymerase Rpb6 [Trypanosoma vivax]|uniref:Putative DNA-directed RNA polymerase subunit n=1 Tax=Trypanosoma vivax (strain Y486) TaxID=1055687 RepID=G0U9P2_TRYVY|nr:putative DNA-directed RNA polymerase subunit [Trypanosoma vivax]KAH8619150.1 putative RNA polymerase Rpb6 [Trypanosoma vivax]CCC52522.1 putative DNA-directed RNA polymerase subunit [Trypanosoma vivax Y486]
MMRSDLISSEAGADAVSVTPLSERRSTPYLTKYELARIVGERARQIVNGTSVFLRDQSCADERSVLEMAERCVDPYSPLVDPIYIAKIELLQGRIPMIVRRTWPDGLTENIPLCELLVDRSMVDIQF